MTILGGRWKIIAGHTAARVPGVSIKLLERNWKTNGRPDSGVLRLPTRMVG
jgi:hypothetical protein